jgi:hypothetical protein
MVERVEDVECWAESAATMAVPSMSQRESASAMTLLEPSLYSTLKSKLISLLTH